MLVKGGPNARFGSRHVQRNVACPFLEPKRLRPQPDTLWRSRVQRLRLV